MLQAIRTHLRNRKRAKINRALDHIYAEMREATDRATTLKRLAESQEAEALTGLRRREQRLIAQAKQIDAQEMMRSIPTRSARAW